MLIAPKDGRTDPSAGAGVLEPDAGSGEGPVVGAGIAHDGPARGHVLRASTGRGAITARAEREGDKKKAKQTVHEFLQRIEARGMRATDCIKKQGVCQCLLEEVYLDKRQEVCDTHIAENRFKTRGFSPEQEVSHGLRGALFLRGDHSLAE